MIKKLHSADLNLLRIFITVCECQGISAASERLDVSPSTISTQLLDLEQRLNLKLCNRGRKGFSMTPEGVEVLKSTYKIFNQVQEFIYETESLHGAVVGRLKIGMIDNIHSHPQLNLPCHLNKFQHDFPKVDLHIDVCEPDDLEQSILNRQFDIGIGVRGKRVPNLTYHRLCDETSVVCCGRNHPLFDIVDEKFDRTLLSQSNWVYDFHRFPDKIPVISRPYISTYVTNIEASLLLVLAGSHLTSLPKHYIQPYLDRGEIKIILEDELTYSLEFSIITNQHRKNEKLISNFRKSLLE